MHLVMQLLHASMSTIDSFFSHPLPTKGDAGAFKIAHRRRRLDQ